MWIRTQNKQRIVNSDQVIDIFIGKTGTKIIATTTCNDLTEITLGEYKDRDTCIKILLQLSVIIGITGKIPGFNMPLGGDVDKWCNSMTELAQAFVIRDLLK